MKVLLAASEVAPIIKLGGLGDVLGSLPKALEKIGVDADVIVPYYPSAKIEKIEIYKTIELLVPFNGEVNQVDVYKAKLPGSNVDVLMLRSLKYFGIGGASAFLNNPSETEMYAFFAKAVVEYIKASFNTYDIIHCHDWHTGLLTHLLKEELGMERPATLFTIHNLFYQGKSNPVLVKEVGIAPGDHQLIDYDISDGDLNLLYQGITSSDFVSTVSESYAKEIRTEEFGGGFADTLEVRKDRLFGIINGIDYSFFPRDFDENNWKVKKQEYKKNLLNKLKIKSFDVPLFSFVSRLDPGQKGLDIMYISLDHMMQKGGNFVLLGTGDKLWEQKFLDLQNEDKYKDKISINVAFSTQLANEIYAASDFFLVPSRYEPCGLTQMIAMHYGALPIVRAVGGLKDSVKDRQNGILFDKYSSLELNKALDSAFRIYNDKDVLDKMVINALKEDFSWDKSAEKYLDLYNKILEVLE
ncbi:hypothetical protein A2V49_02075 [candidate division WWE3 bacterium RBG_19FT_COMBO_34_6]|uniref:Glycogen synthase n=1 Tax=candidate division WWE3 bacterium RBG_19FT_COMBO_34_6 TaxID=1802612 RepID=A0A1F4UK03_UNCKA|nr:MAG: hypothetical protein A2V49_02075 [candidate division WWE3 bacterium RBG_19FT_COMBO_34_6]